MSVLDDLTGWEPWEPAEHGFDAIDIDPAECAYCATPCVSREPLSGDRCCADCWQLIECLGVEW